MKPPPRGLASANALLQNGRFAEARSLYLTLLKANPRSAAALNGLGQIAFRENAGAAQRFFERAVAADPGFNGARLNLALALARSELFTEARDQLREVIRRDPSSPYAYERLGDLYMQLRLHDEAVAEYRRAFELSGDRAAFLNFIKAKRLVCDWTDFDEDEQKVLAFCRAGASINPFTVASIGSTLDDQFKAALLWATRFAQAKPVTRPPRPGGGRLRIGYLSNDFHDHATAFLIAELIEQHDRDRFEIHLLSTGGATGGEEQQRLAAAADGFHVLTQLSDLDAAKAIAAIGIDILLDLKGYTSGARPGIDAHRPAPIQVNYLGFPGTMGAGFIDYVIADAAVCPFEFQPWCTEKIVHLDCFQPNDSQRAIATTPISRAEARLPAEAMVFCSFASSYKLNPTMVALWARVLEAVPGSVLWLFALTPGAQTNLAAQARIHGIDPDRLVFTRDLPQAQHLRRLQLADLCLDTLPVSAFTTASDALWAGVPILTCTGPTSAGRGGAAILTAMDLPELITSSLNDYENAAIDLGRDPARLAALRKTIQDRRATSRLFDSRRHAQMLERALTEMWRRHQAGEPPAPFSV